MANCLNAEHGEEYKEDLFQIIDFLDETEERSHLLTGNKCHLFLLSIRFKVFTYEVSIIFLNNQG